MRSERSRVSVGDGGDGSVGTGGEGALAWGTLQNKPPRLLFCEMGAGKELSKQQEALGVCHPGPANHATRKNL